tara:strand:- start:32 stop:133 length:102 start_codon:yes stop_codon:yes gene_type:complete
MNKRERLGWRAEIHIRDDAGGKFRDICRLDAEI